jgi:dTMP kinase
MTHGRFITLEGGEGAGKTTAVALVQRWLKARGRTVCLTREPGGTKAAERVREILLDPDSGDLDPMTELLLMFAARSENIVRIIRPALERGEDVICDRFTDASRAYQGAGRGLGDERVNRLAQLVHDRFWPHLTLLLDVPVAVGLERVGRRGNGRDRFEQNQVTFLQRVRDSYLEQARREPERFAIIDAGQTIHSVHDQIIACLEERLT